jgi:hypothetical protein
MTQEQLMCRSLYGVMQKCRIVWNRFTSLFLSQPFDSVLWRQCCDLRVLMCWAKVWAMDAFSFNAGWQCEVQTANLIYLWYSRIYSNVNNVLETKTCTIIAYCLYRFLLRVPEIGLGKSLSLYPGKLYKIRIGYRKKTLQRTVWAP